jgi:hypothetical protein
MLAARMNKLSLLPVVGRTAGIAIAGVTKAGLPYIVFLLLPRQIECHARFTRRNTISPNLIFKSAAADLPGLQNNNLCKTRQLLNSFVFYTIYAILASILYIIVYHKQHY